MYPGSPVVHIEKEYGMDKVAVGLYWAQENHENLFVSYVVSVIPTVDATVTMISTTRANLTLYYNTPYNVSVVTDLCGSQATTIIEIHYGECMSLLLISYQV